MSSLTAATSGEAFAPRAHCGGQGAPCLYMLSQDLFWSSHWLVRTFQCWCLVLSAHSPLHNLQCTHGRCTLSCAVLVARLCVASTFKLSATYTYPTDRRYENTERRKAMVESKGLLYMGMGVSGGEEGARRGEFCWCWEGRVMCCGLPRRSRMIRVM